MTLRSWIAPDDFWHGYGYEIACCNKRDTWHLRTREIAIYHVIRTWYRIMSHVCRKLGHKIVDESYGGPDSGCMAGYCTRCGFSWHTTLY